jgi:hypothetical protein
MGRDPFTACDETCAIEHAHYHARKFQFTCTKKVHLKKYFFLVVKKVWRSTNQYRVPPWNKDNNYSLLLIRPIIYYIAHCGAWNLASVPWFKRARLSQSRWAIYHSPIPLTCKHCPLHDYSLWLKKPAYKSICPPAWSRYDVNKNDMKPWRYVMRTFNTTIRNKQELIKILRNINDLNLCKTGDLKLYLQSQSMISSCWSVEFRLKFQSENLLMPPELKE